MLNQEVPTSCFLCHCVFKADSLTSYQFSGITFLPSSFKEKIKEVFKNGRFINNYLERNK